ncbi:uroporphyrinogen-III synthase [Ectobacillus panaciterrae]|uniref:uroporphyrinogen-III synthase n=1 Tax=Ectobacillus panaciterrae TaxID=363872 RepID=UPI0004272AB3|nr:uroporphyrinogen-III synthase [Ectobacillus panaciterrae]
MTLAPLSNRTVLITRAKAQAAEMAMAVRERGGIPVEIPLLHIVSASYEIEEQVLHTYDWLIFTSKNGVRFFFESLETKTLPPSLKIAAVGEKTKLALENLGWVVRFIPSVYEAEVFVKEFTPFLEAGDRVLFPKGDLARNIIPAALREAGIELKEIVAYKTAYNEAMREPLIHVLENEEIDIITFASPSAVSGFVALLEGTNWRQWVKRCTIGCIGPITEREAAKYFQSLLVPEKYTIDALLDCIAERIQ